MSNNSLLEAELPAYEDTLKFSYTKENISQFKLQLQTIEDELLNIKPNDIRKPQLRRQAADLEEIIINFENTEPKPDIIQSLNDNIELLSEYVQLDKDNILSNCTTFYHDNLQGRSFLDDIECPFRHYITNHKIICDTDIRLIIDYLKNKFPRYSNVFEIHCNNAFKKLVLRPSNEHTFDNLLSSIHIGISTSSTAAIKRRIEIKTFIEETQLNFNKKLSIFIENIIEEKKQMENKIIELERKLNKLIASDYCANNDPNTF